MKKNDKKHEYGSKIKAAIAIALSTSFVFAGKGTAKGEVLRVGDRGEKVEELQRTLRVLELYEYPELEGFFGADTRSALMNFQREHGLEVNGVADADTFEAMDRALDDYYPEIRYTRTMKFKTVGDDVRALQRVLKSMGYYGTNVDGIFNANTASAVRTFQFDYGMAVDGVVNERLVKKINGIAATLRPFGSNSEQDYYEDDAQDPVEPSDNESDNKLYTDAVKMQWSAVNRLWRVGRTVKIIDVETGEVIFLKRVGGINHADVEPVTESDTDKLRNIFGGNWSWARRPVVAEVAYITSAASICGMPHGDNEIYGNGVSGHFCMHFFESSDDEFWLTDSAHQRAIDIASDYSITRC